MNEWGFRPPLCTYRLNWGRRTSWGWWDEWDDTALQTQDSKFEPWWSEAEHAISQSWRFTHNIESLRVSGEETFCFFETWRPEWGSKPRSLTFQAGSFNHRTRTPALIIVPCRVFWPSEVFSKKSILSVAQRTKLPFLTKDGNRNPPVLFIRSATPHVIRFSMLIIIAFLC